MRIAVLTVSLVLMSFFALAESATKENKLSCFDSITNPPYCVGLSLAEDFCLGFGRHEEVLNMAKDMFHELVSEGQDSVDASVQAFLGYSSDQSEACNNNN